MPYFYKEKRYQQIIPFKSFFFFLWVVSCIFKKIFHVLNNFETSLSKDDIKLTVLRTGLRLDGDEE